MNGFGQFVDGVQRSIDPEPDQADLPFRLDMNITCPLVKRVMKDMIYRIFDMLIG